MSTKTVLIILLVLAGVALFIYQRRNRLDPVTLTESQQDPLFWEILSLCRPVSEYEVETNAGRRDFQIRGHIGRFAILVKQALLYSLFHSEEHWSR